MLDTSYKFSRRLSFLLFFIELKRGGVSFFTFHVKGDFFSERRAPSGFLSLLSSFFSFLKGKEKVGFIEGLGSNELRMGGKVQQTLKWVTST